MKTINEYEIINHGICHSDYFQGCGTAFTEFIDVATGIGNSEQEALDDALEILAQGDWDVACNADLNADLDRADDTDVVTPIVKEYGNGDENYENPWVHVSVRVK